MEVKIHKNTAKKNIDYIYHLITLLINYCRVEKNIPIIKRNLIELKR